MILKHAVIGLIVLQMGCAAQFVKYEKAEELKQNTEFENSVKIVKPQEVEADAAATTESLEAPKAVTTLDPKSKTTKKSAAKNEIKSDKTTQAKSDVKPAQKFRSSKNKADKKQAVTSAQSEEKKSPLREPELEDAEGFSGRRPLVDPFKVGEEVVHEVSYFKVKAGTLKLKVDPYAIVNNKKAYNFVTEINSSSVFSSFYSVDDRTEALVDFDTLSAITYTLHVKESGQLREGRSFFDYDKHVASYWEKKYTKTKGHEEKKQEWELLPFSQNVFSAIFYMRVFQWKVGKEISFRVSHDNESIVFKGTAVREEVLDTDAGKFNAIVIKPQISVKGAFKPMGDIYVWLSNDERKYILRIESSIKIGTLVSEVVEIKSGK